MKFKSLLLLAPVVLALAGCSSTKTNVDSGTIRAQTFSFVDRTTKPPDYAEAREGIHAKVQESITKNLAARGVTKAASGGDVMVAYLVIVGNNASTASINDFFGYGRDDSGLHDKAQAAYAGDKNPNYFEAGTLVIDIIDGKSYKLLKRGYTTRKVVENLSEDQRAARYQEAVDEILRDLKIKH